MNERALAVSLLAWGLALPAAAQTTAVPLRTQARDVDFSGAAFTKPFRTGTELPGTCSVGEAFFKTNEPAGANWFGCAESNVWTLESGASGVPTAAGQAGKVLSNDGTAALWQALGGDLSGAPEAAVVAGIQGRPVGSIAPADGQVLRWNATAGEWQPFPVPAAYANFAQPFTGATTVEIAGSAHGLSTANILVQCYDNSSPAALLDPASVTVNGSTFDVTIQFGSAQSGRCVLNGSGAANVVSTVASNTFATGTTQTFQGALVATSADRTAPVQMGTALPGSCTPGDQFFKSDAAAGRNLYFCTGSNIWTQMTGGTGAVASVFGRTGTVSAQSGDYSFSQLSGTAGDSQIGAGINASKVGAGTVSNTKFGYLSNVSADIQAQLDGKAASAHSHGTSGDLSGDVSAATVTRIQNRAVASTAPADGQALVWSTAAGAWQPAAVSSSGGASMVTQLKDLAVSRTSDTVLTIGGQCSTATTCNVRFGNVVYSFDRSCTATISGGTGTAFVYVTPGGTLTIGHNLTVAASTGCLAQPGVTAFPADSVPLYTWTANAGHWDSDGGADRRAALSNKPILPGTGVMTVESGGRTIVSVDSAVVPTYLTGSAVINFASIPASGCGEQTFTLTGATVSDAVAGGWPAALEQGLVGLMRVSASNVVSVRLCNVTGSAIDPASAAFRATIVRAF